MQRPRPDRHPAADRGPAIDWAALRRVLVVRADNLGDVIMLTPALRALRRVLPAGAVLDLLGSPVGTSLLPCIPELSGVLTTSPVWQDASGQRAVDVTAQHDLVERLREGHYDAMVVFTSFAQSPWPAAYAGYLAGIPIRAGHSREFGGAVLSHWVSSPVEDLHQVDRCLHLIGALGVTRAGTAPRLVADPAARTAAWSAPAASYAVLAPGASCSARRYPRFAEVARSLAETGLPVVVAGPLGEAELVTAVVREAGHPEVTGVLCGQTEQFVALVADAGIAVTNNSGGMHVADAVGTPVVAAYAGTERISELAPRSVPARLLQRQTACSPCRQFSCPYERECLDVDPAEVVAAAMALLRSGDYRQEEVPRCSG